MRINGISPHSPSSAVRPKISPHVKNTSQTGISHSQSAQNSSSLPISRDELKNLAEGLRSGAIDKAQANSLFISTVINNSLKCKLGEQDRDQLIKDIQDFLADDENFLAKLTKNLNDFS